MKFRYFILQGESLAFYLAAEEKEFLQRHNQHEILLGQRDDIESFRPDHSGGIMSILFKEGKQPKGMIRAHKDLPKNEVRPHATNKDAKELRDLLKSLRVTEDSQNEIRRHM